ncbi:MAG: glycoside hydrolase family 3 C-terminal domain-containing protein, partial [Actinomycetota bacterium]
STLLRFDQVLSSPSPSTDILGRPEHRALAREAASRAVLLLRNEAVDGVPALPLDPAQRVAVIGRLADAVNIGDGGSSDVWDLSCSTVLDGLREAIADVVHDDGTDLTRAAAVAGAADLAIVVVGYTYLDEGEYIGETDPSLMSLFPPGDEADVVDQFHASLHDLPPATRPERLAERPRMFSRGGDRSSLRLLAEDVALIQSVAAANRRTVVVIQAGSAVITTEWANDVAAIVQAWYGGAQAGPGLADVLVGNVNPSARLPFTVPVDEADLPDFDRDATTFTYDRWHGWWRAERNGVAPAHRFGFGLSYTTFALGGIETTVDGASIVVRGTLHNTGSRDGTDVVQVYATLPDAAAPARLIGFARVDVAAAASTSFEIIVPIERLATRDSEQKCWRTPAGRHHITTARFAGDPQATGADIDL